MAAPLIIAIVAALTVSGAAVVVAFRTVPSLYGRHITMQGASMEHTISIGAHLLIDTHAYRSHPPRRGDIVMFVGGGTGYPQGGRDEFVARVIAIGGDAIQCCTDGEVVLNGVVLAEPYVDLDSSVGSSGEVPFCFGGPHPDTVPMIGASCSARDAQPFRVPAGMLFVMGDHRSDSADSRYYGVVPVTSVLGKLDH